MAPVNLCARAASDGNRIAAATEPLADRLIRPSQPPGQLAQASHTIEGARHGPLLPMRIVSCATPAHHGPPDFICRGCDSFGADASIESFGLAADLLVSLRLRVGDGRRSDSEGRGAGAGGSSEAAEPSSQRKCRADRSHTSRNEHARSRGSRTGVGVRRDPARSACWFRRIST